VELGASRRGQGRLDLAASYTWMDAENQSPGADTGKLQNRPEHKLAVRADYEIRPRVSVGASWLYVAGNYVLSRTTPTTAQELDEFQVLDLDASFGFANGRGRLFGRIENALDELYEESFGFPQPGRTFVVGAEYRYGGS